MASKAAYHNNIALGQRLSDLRAFSKVQRWALLALVCVCVFVALMWVAFDDDGALSFEAPVAFASVQRHAVDGHVPAYTAAEKRYVLRAVAANPENLVKLDGYGVRAVLDAPHFVRADFPTVIWQYRTERCVMDVFFHTSEESRDAADFAPVVHYESRSRAISSTSEEDEACLSDFIPSGYGPRMVSVSAFYKSYIQ